MARAGRRRSAAAAAGDLIVVKVSGNRLGRQNGQSGSDCRQGG